MKCPRCGTEQPQNIECARCGVIISKWLERNAPTSKPAQKAGPTEASPAAQADSSGRPARVAQEVQRLFQPSNIRAFSGSMLRQSLVLLFPPWVVLRQFYGTLQRLIRSGAGLDMGMRALAEQGWGRFRRLSQALHQGISSGKGVGHSLLATGLVPRLHTGLLQAGEQLGTMPEMLGLLIDHCQSRIDFRNRILKASIYPILLMVISAFMMPLPTLIFGSGSSYAMAVTGLLVRAAGAVAAVYVAIRMLPALLGGLTRFIPGSIELALFPGRRAQAMWVLHSAMKAGVPWAQALDLASRCFTSDANLKVFKQAYESISGGGGVVGALSPLVHRSFRVLLLSGELSGSMEEVFAELYEEYAERARRRVALVTTIASVLVLVGALAYVAGQTFGSLQNALTIPTEQLEELNRELKGTGMRIF